MSTMIFIEEEILQVCEIDAQLILKAYSVSDALGVVAIKNSISDFTMEIIKHKGKIMTSLDLDYRFYVSNLLNLSVASADDILKAKIFSEIVIPSSSMVKQKWKKKWHTQSL